MKILRQEPIVNLVTTYSDETGEQQKEQIFPAEVKYQISKQDSVITFTFILRDSMLKSRVPVEVYLLDTNAQSESPISSNGGVITLEVDLQRFAGELIDIEYSQANTTPYIMITPALTNYALGGNLPNRLFRKGEFRLVRMMVNATGDDAVIQLMKPSEEIEGFENVIMEPTKTMMASLMDNSPEAAAIINKHQLKSLLLSNIDARDSITYLEIQLDALTRYILSDKTDENALAILNKAMESNALDARGQEALLGEFTHKANVREQLQTYYAATQDLES